MDLAQVEKSTQMEVLNFVRDHLLKQGHQSVDLDGHCKYRGPKGRSCGGGCLMSDADYARLNEMYLRTKCDQGLNIEGFSWGNLCDRDLVSRVHEKLIKALQQVHDAGSVREWPAALKEVERHIRIGEYDA